MVHVGMGRKSTAPFRHPQGLAAARGQSHGRADGQQSALPCQLFSVDRAHG